MEKLAEELSKLFNVSASTIENIIQHYPKLRGQMVIYKILNEISAFAYVMILTILVVNIYFYFISSIMTEKSKGNSKKRFNISIVAFVAAVIIILMMNILESILAPDYMFVRTILDTLN